jgi:hypothetical protein
VKEVLDDGPVSIVGSKYSVGRAAQMTRKLPGPSKFPPPFNFTWWDLETKRTKPLL